MVSSVEFGGIKTGDPSSLLSTDGDTAGELWPVLDLPAPERNGSTGESPAD